MPELACPPSKIGNYIGHGAERYVYDITDDPTKIVGLETFETLPQRMKINFYLGNILYLLLPEHFPRIYFSQGGKKPQTIAEKIICDKKSEPTDLYSDIESLYTKLRIFGFDTDLLDDNIRANWGYRNGKIVYLDKVDLDGLINSRGQVLIRKIRKGQNPYAFDFVKLKDSLTHIDPQTRNRILRHFQSYKRVMDSFTIKYTTNSHRRKFNF